jgi:hypothetical protein
MHLCFKNRKIFITIYVALHDDARNHEREEREQGTLSHNLDVP